MGRLSSNKRPALLLLTPSARSLLRCFSSRTPALTWGSSLTCVDGTLCVIFGVCDPVSLLFVVFQSAAGGSGAERCRFSTEKPSSGRNLRRTCGRTRRFFSVKSHTKSSGHTSKCPWAHLSHLCAGEGAVRAAGLKFEGRPGE